VCRAIHAAWENIVLISKITFYDPGLDGRPCRFRELKLNWSVSFLLDDDGSLIDPAADANFSNPHGQEIATTQFAVDCQVEQGKIAHSPLDL
jgi:hypothetical protein